MKVRNNFMSLDLEMNQAGTPKIIQIGAVIGDPKTGVIIDRICLFVNPSEQITQMITDLTGITQEQVDEAPDLLTQFRALREWQSQHYCFCNPIVWGGGDSAFLKAELEKYYTHEEIGSWPFGRRWIDTKTLYQSWKLSQGHSSMQGGLKAALRVFKIPSTGRHHDALVDAENTFNLFSFMLRKFIE